MVLDIDHSSLRLSTVMNIFRSRFYRLNVILLSMIGLWPYQKHKKWQFFQQIMCQMSVITIILPEILRVVDKWGDMDILIECLTPMGIQIFSSIKFINCFVHQNKMKELFEVIKKDWSDLKNEKEIEILGKYAEDGRNLTIIYTAFLYCTIFIFNVIPLLPKFLDVIAPLNESRHIAFPFPGHYYVDPQEYFIWIILHTYPISVVVTTIIIATDTMFVCYVTHVCGILAVIGHRLENLTSKRSDTDASVCIMPKDDNDRCYREIVFCIEQHCKATEVAKIIESTYSLSYLLVLGICVLLLSISLVQILIEFDQVEEIVRLVEFNIAQCGHLLFNSWPCQKLIDESKDFRKSLYAAEWYSLSEKNKNLLKFVLLRTLKPEKITVGKLYVMSMENFGVIIQTALSYFMVFASIR